MKKESILVRVIAVLLAINLCFGLVGIAMFGAIKPMTVSFVKNVAADEIIEEISERVDSNDANKEIEKEVLDKIVNNSDQVEDLINIYVDGLNNAIKNNSSVKFEDTSAIYDKLNNEIVELYEIQEGVTLNKEQRKIVEKKLEKEEAKLEKDLAKVAKEINSQTSDDSNSGSYNSINAAKQQYTTAFEIYSGFVSGKYLIIYAIILVILAAIIIAMRWKSKGWLINIGVAGIVASLFIVVIPSFINFFVEVVMEKQYVIAGSNYFYIFAGVTAVIGIVMIVLKNTLFKVKKVAEENMSVEYNSGNNLENSDESNFE